jgi:uncharacterized protein
MPKVNTATSPPAGTAKRADSRVEDLETAVCKLYQSAKDHLPFHGWPHICFVTKKAVQFAKERQANPLLVAAASLVHDLNYVVRSNSEPADGRRLRHRYLRNAGFKNDEIARVEEIINEAHTATRSESISPEGSALSDADTLFKALPVTPVVFSHLYLAENGVGLRELAEKIVGEQEPLIEKNIYFYDATVRDRYIPWAEANMKLWQEIIRALKDRDVVDLLSEVNVKI